MKIFVIITLLFTLQLKAGQEGGGGGHPCKADFMQIYRDIKSASKEQGSLFIMHGALYDIISVLEGNSLVRIEVLDTKIKDCPLAQSPMACSKPEENLIQLYCGNDGWLSQSPSDRILTVMHELLWWSSSYNDSNYFYSTAILKDFKPLIKNKRIWDFKLIISD